MGYRQSQYRDCSWYLKKSSLDIPHDCQGYILLDRIHQTWDFDSQLFSVVPESTVHHHNKKSHLEVCYRLNKPHTGLLETAHHLLALDQSQVVPLVNCRAMVQKLGK